MRDLGVNLWCGLRAAVLLPPAAARWRPFPAQLLLIGLLDVLVGIGANVYAVGTVGSLDPVAVPRALLPVPLALFAGLVIARLARQPSLLLAIAVALSVVTLWFDVAWALLGVSEPLVRLLPAVDDSLVDAVVFAWWAVALGLVAVRLTRTRWLPRLAGAGWAAVIVALPFWWIPYLPLWEEPEAASPSGVGAGALGREQAFYRQGEVLDKALEALQRERPGVEDLYFVGAAGYAAEDVFMNEVGLATELMRARFDTDGRMVALVNNPRTVLVLPVASVTSLSRTLEAVAEVMDRDEDVLFLYISTHGSASHHLALEFWPLELDDLTPAVLKAMLDEAGIRWRVIAISACYAGGFIEPLQDPRTLIITAADAEHPSFGCGADSDLTWFGKAYFDEALRQTYSFTKAFETARGAIARREREQGFEPSNPQMVVGAEIAAKLDRMERRLVRQADPPMREALAGGSGRMLAHPAVDRAAASCVVVAPGPHSVSLAGGMAGKESRNDQFWAAAVVGSRVADRARAGTGGARARCAGLGPHESYRGADANR